MNELQKILDKYNEQAPGRTMYRDAFPEITNELAKQLTTLKMTRGTRTVLAAAVAVLGKALHNAPTDPEKMYASIMYNSCHAKLYGKEHKDDDTGIH